MGRKRAEKPWGFLAAMRHLERRAGKKPRIGKNRRRADDIVELGQDPYLSFAASDLSEVDITARPPRVRPRFLGFFGPFGSMPISQAREVDRWARNGDWSFVRFTDMLVTRFQQLFYRSWSDARPITQFDHPSGGEFPRMLRALTGDAAPCYDGAGAVGDIARLRYTALASGRVKSPTRLRAILRAHFGVPVRVEEFASSWMEFAREDCSVLGFSGMSLGQNLHAGARTATIGEKVVIHVDCRSRPEYESFLPGAPRQAELADLVLSYLGLFYAVDVALWLPRREVGGIILGQSGQLGWTTGTPAAATQPKGTRVRATQFQLTPDIIYRN
ncbi:MAG: type VI secretion system baseplate subunit TssG [Pseudomonadota bacterium]